MVAHMGLWPGVAAESGELADFQKATWASLPSSPVVGEQYDLGSGEERAVMTFSDALHASQDIWTPNFTLDAGALHSDVVLAFLAELQGGSDGVGLETFVNSVPGGSDYSQATENVRPVFRATGGPQGVGALDNTASPAARYYNLGGTLDQIQNENRLMWAGTLKWTNLATYWVRFHYGGAGGAGLGIGCTTSGLRVQLRRYSSVGYTTLDLHATAAGTTPTDTWYPVVVYWDAELGKAKVYFGESTRTYEAGSPNAGTTTDIEATNSQLFAGGTGANDFEGLVGEEWLFRDSLVTPANAEAMFAYLRLKCGL